MSGNVVKDLHPKNIPYIVLALEVSQLEIPVNDVNDLQQWNICIKS